MRTTRASHVFRALHQRGEDLVVVLTSTQIARDAVRHLLTSRIGIPLEEADRRHDEAGHAEGALEALLVEHAALHRVQLASGAGQSFDRDDRTGPHGVGEDRARVVWNVVDEYGARTTLGAIASQLGAREPQLVAQRHGQRFLLHDVYAPHLSVDVQRDQTLDRTG